MMYQVSSYSFQKRCSYSILNVKNSCFSGHLDVIPCSSLHAKFCPWWPLVTSILISEKNYPNVFCSTFPNLPNAVFRFSLTCVVFEIVGGGGNQPPPGRWCSAETTGCARVNFIPISMQQTMFYGHFSRSRRKNQLINMCYDVKWPKSAIWTRDLRWPWPQKRSPRAKDDASIFHRLE